MQKDSETLDARWETLCEALNLPHDTSVIDMLNHLRDTSLIGRLHRHFSDARKAGREATVIIVQRPFDDEVTLVVDGKLCGDAVTPSTLGKTLESALPLVWPRKP